MIKLILTRMQVQDITLRQLFRSAYYHKFGKDIPISLLDEDIKTFIFLEKAPPYLLGFLGHS